MDGGSVTVCAAASVGDIYEVIIERHRRASTIFTSNRAVEEWIPLFEDAVLAQSALDRLAHNAHQVVMEGESYRPRLGPRAHAAARSTRSKTR